MFDKREIRRALADAFRELIGSTGETQAWAARTAGISQSDAARIFNRQVDHISVERLFSILLSLGASVRVEVEHDGSIFATEAVPGLQGSKA